MKFIGITGGVGAGKSEILSYMGKKTGVRVMLADEIAHELMEAGTDCYKCLRQTFNDEDIWNSDGSFNREKLAKVIFSNKLKRDIMNSVVHPAVKEYVIRQQEYEKERGELSLLVLEAALLIEEHYDKICDELWYIYTSEENRRDRLKASRGYSDEKIDNIFKSQLSEEEYRKYCAVVIDNNGSVEAAFEQIDKALVNEE